MSGKICFPGGGPDWDDDSAGPAYDADGDFPHDDGTPWQQGTHHLTRIPLTSAFDNVTIRLHIHSTPAAAIQH